MSGDRAANRALAEAVASRLLPLGPIELRHFFGGHALTLDGVQFAFLFGQRLWLRTDEATRPRFLAAGAEPFSYEGSGGRRVMVASYFEAPGEVMADPAELVGWAQRAHAAAVKAKRPAPKGRRRQLQPG